MVVEQNKTYVARLRVRSAARETLSVQLRLNQALASLNLHPASLPPSAIAFIRKLTDPAPGSIKLSWERRHPACLLNRFALQSQQAGCLRSQDDTAVVPVAWERAVVDSVDQIVRRAARPALEHVGAGVDAVLFIDRAEMLACLAIDCCDGTAITRWWWQSLFRATDVSSAVFRAWLTSIEYVPAAFAKLAEKKMAVSFAAALPARTANKFLEVIIRHFGLSQFGSDASAPRSETKTEPSSASKDLKRNQSQGHESLSSSEMLQLRTRLAPEAFSGHLEHDARRLLAVALMLERAPAMLRSRGFASRLLRSLSALNTINFTVEASADET